MRRLRGKAGHGLELLSLAVSLALVGCGADHALSPLVVEPDSTRWVDAGGRNRPYALVWKNGTANLWMSDTFLYQCQYVGPVTVAEWDAAFRGKVVGDSVTGDLTAWHSDDGAQVTGGRFAVMVGPDSVARGLVQVEVAAPCGVVLDVLPLTLVPAR